MPAESMQNASQDLADSALGSTPFWLSFAVPLQVPEWVCWPESLVMDIRGEQSPGMHKLKHYDPQQACLLSRCRMPVRT